MLIVDKTTGDELTAVEFNQIPDEIEQVISDSGQGPSAVDVEQLTKGIYRLASEASWYTDSGAADAYVLTSAGGVTPLPGNFDGKLIRFIPGNTNTGASTVNVNSEGLTPLRDIAGAPLIGGEIIAGQESIATFVSSTGDYRLLTAAATTSIEVDNAITDSGQTPSAVDLFELSKAFSNFSGNGSYYADPTGGTNVYVLGLNVTQKEPTAMFAGLEVRFKADFTNTGNTSITMPTLGTFVLRNFDNTELQPGTIIAGSLVIAFFDGSGFRLPLLSIPADTLESNNTLVRRDSSSDIAVNGINTTTGDLQLGPTTGGNIFIGAAGEVILDRTGGLTKLSTRSDGTTIFGSTNNAIGGTQDSKTVLSNSGGTALAIIGYDATTDLELRNLNNGGSVVITANDVGGSLRNILQADPDAETTLTADTNLNLVVNSNEAAITCTGNGNVQLFQDSISTARTTGSVAGGFEVNNTFTGGGFERVLTASDLGALEFNVFKTFSTARSNNTIPTADPDLVVTLPSGGTYRFQLYVEWINGTSIEGDISFLFNVDAGAIAPSGALLASDQLVSDNIATITSATNITNINQNTVAGFTVTGSFTASVAADFSFNWSQVTSTGDATVVNGGSWLHVVKLS